MGKPKIYISAGPYYGKLIKAQGIVKYIQNNRVMQKLIGDQKDIYKEYDFGISYSLGVILKKFEKMKILMGSAVAMDYVNVIKVQPVCC